MRRAEGRAQWRAMGETYSSSGLQLFDDDEGATNTNTYRRIRRSVH